MNCLKLLLLNFSEKPNRMKNNFWKALGPGLIWAAAAIGVSHLVQSTRAGASYGFQLVVVVLLANLFKYPFFQFGPRYAVATNTSLVEGYRKRGMWAVVLFAVLTLGTMFTIQAAVTSVTVGIIKSVFPVDLSYTAVTIILILICAIIVLIGHYKVLDRLIKFVIIILSISTLIALFSAFAKNTEPVRLNQLPFEFNITNISFIVALVGWMPSAIDISVWNSLWTLAKIKETNYRPTLKESLLDFNIGYIGTTFFALAFLGLGALVMFNRGAEFAQSGVQFANQLFGLYTTGIGDWAYYIIAIAALTTMFSTTLTVLDAYPRVITPVVEALSRKTFTPKRNTIFQYIWMAVLIIGAVLLISVYSTKMKLLVDIATTLSFITAPVLGFLNLKAITGKEVDQEYRPSKGLVIFSWIGIAVLAVFALYFLWLRFLA